MKGKFVVHQPDYIDKSFDIENEDIRMSVDYDDVDHKAVEKAARWVVKTLNAQVCSKKGK